MPDPQPAQLSCLSLSPSAFEEQNPFSGQVWSCLLNQGLFLPWVHGTGVAVWIKSASFRIWLLWQIRGGDSTGPTKGPGGKTCLGRDLSPCSLAGHGVCVEMMPFPRVRGGELQLCPLLTSHLSGALSSLMDFCISGWGVQLQQSSTARAGNAPAMEATELPTPVGAAVKQMCFICDMSSGRSCPCEPGL